MRIVSVPDRLVRDPATRRVVDEVGISIDPTDLYWSRLLADGDVAEPRVSSRRTKESAS